ncbi:RNA 2',3'-cyclic phosphodiesterase [Candidatus Woesearchaeota archaeon]|nr:RNA 2',3'-cyclic phosphodiesterase [Candidatus Woesearchaeota archaeon]
MRIFIAIHPPEELNEVFRRLQRALPHAGLSFPKTFHLTLKFLGEVPEKDVAAVRKALQGIAVVPFSLTTSGIGVFPNESFIKVVYVGIKGEGIRQLQKSVDAALKGIGFPSEKEFSPHITIARVKVLQDKHEFAKAIKAIPREDHAFAVHAISLMKSTLAKGGAVHEQLEEYA